jgi:hypothetical protein
MVQRRPEHRGDSWELVGKPIPTPQEPSIAGFHGRQPPSPSTSITLSSPPSPPYPESGVQNCTGMYPVVVLAQYTNVRKTGAVEFPESL